MVVVVSDFYQVIKYFHLKNLIIIFTLHSCLLVCLKFSTVILKGNRHLKSSSLQGRGLRVVNGPCCMDFQGRGLKRKLKLGLWDRLGGGLWTQLIWTHNLHYYLTGNCNSHVGPLAKEKDFWIKEYIDHHDDIKMRNILLSKNIQNLRAYIKLVKIFTNTADKRLTSFLCKKLLWID